MNTQERIKFNRKRVGRYYQFKTNFYKVIKMNDDGTIVSWCVMDDIAPRIVVSDPTLEDIDIKEISRRKFYNAVYNFMETRTDLGLTVNQW